MVKQIRYLLFVFLFGTISCLPPKTTVNAFRNKYYCHCEKEKGLSDLINLNGYYSMSEAISYNYGYPSQIVHDTIEINTIFYDNGMVLYSFSKDQFLKSKDKKIGFYNRGMALWGSYIIQNDTIKAVFSQNPGGMSWSIGYVWFEIIDSTSIREIYFKWREPITKDDTSKTHLNNNNNIAVFVNYEMLPNPDRSWLKREKWFWCNEKDWKNYMDSMNVQSKK